MAFVGADGIVLVQSNEILNPTIGPFPSVVNDSPGVRHFDIAMVDLTHHAPTGRLLATTYGDVEDFGNSVLVIDPQSGSIERALYSGSGPTVISQSQDGQALFVALGGESSVTRLDLNSSELTQFEVGRNDFNGPLFAEDLAAILGSNHSVAVSLRNVGLSPRNEGVAVYDGGVKRPAMMFHHGGNNLIEAGATTLYGSDIETSDRVLRVMSMVAGRVPRVL